MPTDLLSMTTLDLLRELKARGMPAGWRLTQGDCTLKGPPNRGGGYVHADLDEFVFEHMSECSFIVALQAHLAGMGVATEMIPDCDGHPLWCCRPVLRSGAVKGSTVSYRVDKAPVFGPGVDGLLRAAVGALREVQGGQ